ncbi:MAG TPA: cyclic 2,3-diphosphoglycerate synthase [Candidatus Polarisedimenticolaceae bacterium]|nr:cyclic 2,3-diphosphoglycerate synthase [Candidatus Polarisedimenticolaceae bacterium]
METRVIIMGAAGRDFHNFNVVFRDDSESRVVAFTATQIPNIDDRRYPAALAGPRYPQGIPIHPEADLPALIHDLKADEVVFAYSDVAHETVMHKASIVLAAGADFRLIGPDASMIRSKVPIVSVCAVRTGAGKSQTTRKVCQILRAKGRRTVAIRHPMPYGDLVKQRVQRFANLEDLDLHECTIEEREEYEPHIAAGGVIYAGVDYGAILKEAEREADVIVWDGGNNDLPFYKADLEIVVADPHRAGHEMSYHPGEANLRRAHVVVINKEDTANEADIVKVRRTVHAVNPKARIIDAASPILVDDAETIRGKRVLCVEDGPTLTHGEMKYGAGVLAAMKHGATEILDPRPWTVGTISSTFEKYPNIGALLPAMGYGDAQMRDLEATIERCPADVVLIATPIDLRRVITIGKRALRVGYELQEIGKPDLEEVLARF